MKTSQKSFVGTVEEMRQYITIETALLCDGKHEIVQNIFDCKPCALLLDIIPFYPQEIEKCALDGEGFCYSHKVKHYQS